MDYETAVSLGGKEYYYEGRFHVVFDLPDGTQLDLDFGPDGVTPNEMAVEELEARLRGGNA